MFEGNVLCDLCGRWSHFSSCRLKSKMAGLWKCSNCHAKENSLRRSFGKWPLEAYQGLDNVKRQHFMASLGGLTASQTATELESLMADENHSEFYSDAGEFLPLSVWASRGFDAAEIEAKSQPQDVGCAYIQQLCSQGSAQLHQEHRW
jgi:hypothetical protein